MASWSLLDHVEVPEQGTALSHGGLCVSANTSTWTNAEQKHPLESDEEQ